MGSNEKNIPVYAQSILNLGYVSLLESTIETCVGILLQMTAAKEIVLNKN